MGVQAKLIDILSKYIVDNNPEIIINDRPGNSMIDFVSEKMDSVKPLIDKMEEEGKPQYLICERCVDEMTASLKPSKANYVKEVLAEDFPEDYYRFTEFGILTYETLNLIQRCEALFLTYGFTEDTMDNRFLRYAVIAEIHDYLIEQKK